MKLFALRQRKFTFGPAAAEIYLQRHQGKAFLLNPPSHLIHFAAVEEQLPRPHGIVIPRAAGTIFRNVAIDEPQLALADFRVGLAQTRFPLSQRLHFGPDQNDSCLNFIKEGVIV